MDLHAALPSPQQIACHRPKRGCSFNPKKNALSASLPAKNDWCVPCRVWDNGVVNCAAEAEPTQAALRAQFIGPVDETRGTQKSKAKIRNFLSPKQGNVQREPRKRGRKRATPFLARSRFNRVSADELYITVLDVRICRRALNMTINVGGLCVAVPKPV